MGRAKRDIAGSLCRASMEFNISMWSRGHRPLDHIVCLGFLSRLPMLYGIRLGPLWWPIDCETRRRQRPLCKRVIKHTRRRYMRIG